MRISFKNHRDIWLFTALLTAIACATSMIVVLLLYLIGGRHAFQFENAMWSATIIPILVAVPIGFWVGRTGLLLSKTQADLKRLAETDPLTGIANRRSFFEAAERIVAEAPCSLLVIDADHFKNLNDNYGHAIGDRALVRIAEVLQTSFRSTDLICRVGGEEFAVLLPGITADQATVLAQRALDAIADSPIVSDNAIITYSVSCGIAKAERGDTLPELFKRADDAMYQAKRFGRNRIVEHQAA